MKKRIAFTLGEVLITLAIIGVIAALAVPTLIQSTNMMELTSAWKNGFALLSQAFNNIDFQDYKDMSKTTISGGARTIEPFLISKLKYLKENGADGIYPVASLANTYKDYAGNLIGSADAAAMDDGQIILNNGMLVMIEDYNGTGNEKPIVWLDVNGFQKGPNVLGKDLYGMLVSTDNALIPFGSQGSGVEGAGCSDTAISCPSLDGSGGTSIVHCAGICHSAQYIFKEKQ